MQPGTVVRAFAHRQRSEAVVPVIAMNRSIRNRLVGAAIALVVLGIAGCNQPGTPPAPPLAQAPVAPAPTPVAEQFAPYTTLPSLPPAPKSPPPQVHRRLRVVERNQKAYLVDNAGHSYLAARDNANHLYPAFRDPGSGHIFPLYYDSARDNYYRVVRTDSGQFGRNYIGTPANQYYADASPIPGYPTDPVWYTRPPQPVRGPLLPVGYRDYYPPTTCNTAATDYYGADEYYPPSWAPYPPGGYCPPRGYYATPAYAPVIVKPAPRHHSRDWLIAIPLLIGAYLLLRPHHHHDYPVPPVPPYAIYGGYYRQRRWIPVERHPWGYRQTNFVNSRQYNITNIYERTTINNYYGSNPRRTNEPRRTPHVVLANIPPTRPNDSPLYHPHRFADLRPVPLRLARQPRPATPPPGLNRTNNPQNQPPRAMRGRPNQPPRAGFRPVPRPSMMAGNGHPQPLSQAPTPPHRPRANQPRPGQPVVRPVPTPAPRRPLPSSIRRLQHAAQNKPVPAPQRPRVPTRPVPPPKIQPQSRKPHPNPVRAVPPQQTPPRNIQPRVNGRRPAAPPQRVVPPQPNLQRQPRPQSPVPPSMASRPQNPPPGRRLRPNTPPPAAQQPVPRPQPRQPRQQPRPNLPVNPQPVPRPRRVPVGQPPAPPVVRQPRIQQPQVRPSMNRPRPQFAAPSARMNRPRPNPGPKLNNRPGPPAGGPERRRGPRPNGTP